MERSEPTESGSMTIDELARQAGITTRNVRAYQSRGLLPPPQIVGRVAFYGEGHLARLRYIAHLQNVGFSLAGIYHLLEAWEHGRSIADVLGLEQAITAPWSDEVPERYTAGRLHEMFPALAEDPALMERALELGVIAADGEDYVAASPRLIQVGMELVSAGIPVGAVLDAHAELAADTDRMARRFIKLFDTWVWRPLR